MPSQQLPLIDSGGEEGIRYVGLISYNINDSYRMYLVHVENYTAVRLETFLIKVFMTFL